MADEGPQDITRDLMELNRSGAARREVLDRLVDRVDGELRQVARGLMRNERRGHTLQPTALVNEAYLRLVGDSRIDWQNRAHFFGIAAQAMRQILVDHARRKGAAKRGGSWHRVTFDEQLPLGGPSIVDTLDLVDALERLADLDPRMERVVILRFFAGLTVEEVAHLLGVSPRTVHNDWKVARMWLARELADEDAG
jgi:RNA polymerase sigma factor (TIGR02999 family)